MCSVQLTDPPSVADPGGRDGDRPSGDGRASTRRGILRASLSVIVGTVLIAVHASFYGNWMIDDAAITFAYSRNLADGFGPVLQPGAEPVEGFSNPVWMALLALGKLLGLFDHGTIFGVPDYVLFPKGLALLCCMAILALVYVGAKRLTPRPALVTLIAGTALAVNPSFVIWCFSGLENSVYALMVTALAVVILCGVDSGTLLTAKIAMSAGALAALAGLSRPDGVIYAAAFPIVVALFTRRGGVPPAIRAVLLSAAGFVVPFGGYLLFRWIEYGRLLPNTAIAKAQPLPAITDIAKAGTVLQYAGWLLVAVAVVCLALVMQKPSKLRAGVVALLVPFALSVIAFCVLQADWMGQLRFATPIWALGALGGAIVIVETLRKARIRGRILLTATLVVATASSISGFHIQGKSYRAVPKTPFCSVVERDARVTNGVADLLKLPGSAKIGVIDLGGMALVSRLQVVDLAGLADRVIADYLSTADFAGVRRYVFDELRPELISFVGTWDTTLGFAQDERFGQEYEVLYRSPRDPSAFGDVGVWVRKDLVRDPAVLAAAQRYVTTETQKVVAANSVAHLRSCGDTLRPGQTPRP
ncbi:hypothetical protein DL991_04870 [Amycolatopsis sp. WAC 01375]|uniref:hypothetical protein n=1 Tax=Amycolatopsis sp. WAC 01375 TaxID=2203194 RepID=UPI000F79D0F1|nr:hypothetical protein [Amycolatopsis sp. WAC 01375]RSM82689.1 hypothetical protein DL991_04870 [Amycolatopsis sp. WAC 01375]